MLVPPLPPPTAPPLPPTAMTPTRGTCCSRAAAGGTLSSLPTMGIVGQQGIIGGGGCRRGARTVAWLRGFLGLLGVLGVLGVLGLLGFLGLLGLGSSDASEQPRLP